ncbi:MAG: COQ9 family protein [Rickettsiaceae bacterium]|nr:COQ9 family protein [Rickettsiaceae bacterium]
MINTKQTSKKSPKEKHQEAKVKLFESFKDLLKKSNWTEEILTDACTKCKFDPDYHRVLFNGGISQVVMEFENWLNKETLVILEKLEKPKKVREQIALALEARITQVLSKEASIKHNSFFLLPNHVAGGMEAACNSCDLIWRYAGDKSTDFNYYTKRGLLLPVYLSAQTFYYADNSKNHQQTKEFIASSLENVINVASLKDKVKLPKMEDLPIFRFFS